MWILLAFNKKVNKTLICNICLIKNENYETYKTILLYLKLNYKFNPKVMTVDFSKAAYYPVFSILYKDLNCIYLN